MVGRRELQELGPAALRVRHDPVGDDPDDLGPVPAGDPCAGDLQDELVAAGLDDDSIGECLTALGHDGEQAAFEAYADPVVSTGRVRSETNPDEPLTADYAGLAGIRRCVLCFGHYDVLSLLRLIVQSGGGASGRPSRSPYWSRSGIIGT